MFFSSKSWPWMTTEWAILNTFYWTILITMFVNLCVQLIMTFDLKLSIIHSVCNGLIILSLTSLICVVEAIKMNINELACVIVCFVMASLVPSILSFNQV